MATPALVRDFSPQLGRASAMGFWTVGPVAGSLITSIVAAHTLDHFLASGGIDGWKSQFVISGVTALVVFVLALFFLKDLSSRLRDQLWCPSATGPWWRPGPGACPSRTSWPPPPTRGARS